MRLLICAGGTGGGVYPAMAVLQSLREGNRPGIALENILWVGGIGGMERDIVERKGIQFQGVHAAGVHGVGLTSLPNNIAQLVKGFFEARDVLRHFKPHAMLFTGGYVAVPVALAGWSVPSVLYVPDIEPGLALKTLARFADAIAITVEDSKAYFSSRKRMEVTGYPVRSALKEWRREDAFQALAISPQEPVVLVFGGSKGARSINQALLACLRELLGDVQVIHISGYLDWEVVKAAREDLPPRFQERYLAAPYLHERMGAAFTAADLVVSRAGASILGEYPSFGLPALLVPYPHAWRYQKVNAAYLADRGAAIVIEDERLPNKLLPEIRALLADDQRREMMAAKMSALSRPHAAESIGQLLIEVGRKKGDRK